MAAAVDTDKAGSPGNRPVRPEGLPAAAAAIVVASERPDGCWAPLTADRIGATTCCACRPTRFAMVQWVGSSGVGSAAWADDARPNHSALKNSHRLSPVLVYARRFPDVKKRFKKSARNSDAIFLSRDAGGKRNKASAIGRVTTRVGSSGCNGNPRRQRGPSLTLRVTLTAAGIAPRTGRALELTVCAGTKRGSATAQRRCAPGARCLLHEGPCETEERALRRHDSVCLLLDIKIVGVGRQFSWSLSVQCDCAKVKACPPCGETAISSV
jgi:hypothetical protein